MKKMFKAGTAVAVLASASGVIVPIATNMTMMVQAASTVADDTSARSITVHKYNNTDTNVAGTGEEQTVDTTKHEPLEGIPFTIQKITPTDGSSRKDVMEQIKTNKFKPAGDTTYTVDSGAMAKKSGRTAADGSYKFDLGTGTTADGLYVVIEGESASVEKATAPFVVAVPQTKVGEATGDDSLTYDINVYPKNDTKKIDLGLTKAFSDGTQAQSVKAGSTVTWTMTAKTPEDIYTAADADYDESYAKDFHFMDPIDSKSLKVTSDGDIEVKVDGKPLDAADYKIEHLTTVAGYDTVKISLTQSGMKKAAGSTNITAKITTTVIADGSDAIIANTADAYYKGPTNQDAKGTTVTDPKTPGLDPAGDTPNTPADPNKPGDGNPIVYMGNIDIMKTDDSSAATPLANAVFKVAASEADAKAGKWITDVNGKDVEVKTGADGKAEMTGLVVDPTSKTQDYYIVETDAPAGYDVDGQVHKVTATQDTTVDATVKDSDNVLPNLPMTGSQLQLLMYATAGFVMVAAGGSAIYFWRRKKQA